MSSRVDMLWLEITGRCPLECPLHCYAESGPTGSHGSMSAADWRHVVQSAAELGVSRVQLIGGEPTAHPAFPQLVRDAIAAGLGVEVFTNLFHVRPEWWQLYGHPAVSVATSYYSDQAVEHDRVTGRPGSHARTRANLAEAVRRRIAIRAAIIEVVDGQRVEQARADLQALGVQRIGTDRVRGIGRGSRVPPGVLPGVSQLCGRCGVGRAAVGPDGDVWPCVMSRWMRAGNVREQPLNKILAGPVMAELVTAIPAPAAGAGMCKPEEGDGADCAPAEKDACLPDYCEPEGG